MGCARLKKPLPGLAPLVEAGHRTGADALPLAVPFQANTRTLTGSNFRDSVPRRNPGEFTGS